MEKYKKSLIHSAVQTTLLCILLIVVYILFESPALSGFLPSESDNKEYASGLRLGALTGFLLITAFYMIRTIFVVHKPEKLQKMYIKTNDEREKLIKQKTGLATFIITLYCLLFALMVAASYSLAVCKTIVVIIYGMGLIYAGSNLYYRHKY